MRVSAIVLAIAVAGIITWRRRNVSATPTQPRGSAPTQLDRNHFAHADRPWLVVAFTSATCDTCADVQRKVDVLHSAEVGVQEVEFARDRKLHDRYRIDAVPTVVIADVQGVVQFAHIGPISATDLWSAMARCRDPQLPLGECGTTP